MQCLHIGASLYFLRFSTRFFFFSSLVSFEVNGVLVLLLMSCIISFIASVVFLMSISICRVWFLVRVGISSFVASTCFFIALALNCFAVSLSCLILHAYSVEMKVLMFVHVCWMLVCSPTCVPQCQILCMI